MLKLFTFLCVVAMAFAGSKTVPVAAPLTYLIPAPISRTVIEPGTIKYVDYESPLQYTAKYTPPATVNYQPGVYSYPYAAQYAVPYAYGFGYASHH